MHIGYRKMQNAADEAAVLDLECPIEPGWSSWRKTLASALRSKPKSSVEIDMFEAIKWPDAMKPSRSPIHFTNELEVTASPETIWSLLVDTRIWPSFYPGVQHVNLFDGHETLRLGARFETNLAGQDVRASVEEFEPMIRIAWYGGLRSSEASKAYHA